MTGGRPDHAAALRWIAGLLEGAGIPWQVAGGLAARAHGASRPLHDVDIYVADGRFGEALSLAGDHLIRGPLKHRDRHWDLEYAVFLHGAAQVEIASADARYYDGGTGRWIPAEIDFGSSVRMLVMGVRVPVMPRDRLVEYKRRLGREVDRLDLREMGEG